MAPLRWRLTPLGGLRAVALLFSVGAAGCSSPTEPSGTVVGVSPQPPPQVTSLEGKWEGTFRVSRAEPSNCGVLTGCTTNPTLTLTLERSGDELSGVLQLGDGGDRRGSFDVKGRVTDATHVTLFSEPVVVTIPCTGRPTVFGETRLIDWSTRLIDGKSLVGAFTSQEFRTFNVGGTNLCPSGHLTIFAEDVRLIRVP